MTTDQPITSDQLLAMIASLDRAALDRWIENDWVRPERRGEGGRDGCLFRDIDVARVRLILDLRRLSIDDEAMPIVLGLLDQLYALRRRIRLLGQAVLAQPQTVQRSISDSIAAIRRESPD
jgi:chaperone modulatory protein CbpM